MNRLNFRPIAASVIATLGACAAQAALASVIGHMAPAEPVTEARVHELPAAQQTSWLAYLAHSRAATAQDRAVLAAERGGDAPPPAPRRRIRAPACPGIKAPHGTRARRPATSPTTS